jgi:hypothetical protein
MGQIWRSARGRTDPLGAYFPNGRSGAHSFRTRTVGTDAIAHQIAVALLDDIADMDADAELDSPFRRHARVAVNEALLHLNRAAHRIHYAAELDDAAVSRSLGDAAVVRCDGGVDEVTPKAP